MNHSFVAAVWSKNACAKCALPLMNALGEETHSDHVTCESCKNIGPVNKIGKILMCSECEKRENDTVITIPSIDDRLSLEQIRNQVERIVETNAIVNPNGDSVKSIMDEAIRGNIKVYTDFFNAKIPSIQELKQIIDDDESIIGEENKRYALAHALKARIQYLARVLFQTKNGQLEMAAEVKVIQNYMATIIPELRMKIRHEFALNTPNYTPQVITKAKTERAKPASASDKLAANYAKMMKITIEEAKALMNRKLRNECKCKEMPGMCPVHDASAMVKPVKE